MEDKNQCAQCGAQFNSQEELDQHKKEVHNPQKQ
jgi:hypothetical protein